MYRSLVRVLGLLALSLLPMLATAEKSEPLKPGDAARDAEFTAAKLSPDGELLAVTVPGVEETNLAVLRLADLAVVGGFRGGTGSYVHNFWWANSKRLLLTFAQSDGWLDQRVLTGEILAVNWDGTAPAYLFGYKGAASRGTRLRRGTQEYAFATIISTLPQDEDHVLITANPFLWQGGSEEAYAVAYRLNIHNGTTKVVARAPKAGNAYFMADKGGHVRYVSVYSEDRVVHSFARDPLQDSLQFTDDWRPLNILPEGILKAPLPWAFSSDSTAIYLLGRGRTDRQCLFRQNVVAGDVSELACDSERDLSDVIWASDSATPLIASYNSGVPTLRTVDSKHADGRIVAAVTRTFPGQEISSASWSDDGSKFVFEVSSGKNPGDFYLFERATKKVRYLFSRRSWIDPDAMAQREAFSYASRDGSVLHGVVTYPKSKEAKQLSAVIYVHGGPFGVYDSTAWNDVAQLLAQRGYLVFQPNFRGSGGFGWNYEQALKRKWGTLAIEDITDGLRALASKGLIDPSRVCIMGGSFGGYAALMSAVSEPDAYRCVVGYAGVYDLVKWKAYSDVGDSRIGRRYIENYVGADEASLKEQSPINYLDRLKAPMFIVHGVEDKRVPFGQAKQLRSELERRQLPYEWLEKSRETHGFSKPENREEFYGRLLLFFDKHIGAASAQ